MTKAYFDRLKPATRRIKIAQDVLKTLALPKSKRFKPTKGEYCKFEPEGLVFTSGRAQLQTLLPKVERHCEACAMGALFLSHVRLVNNVTLARATEGVFDVNSADIERPVITDILREYFDPTMLALIEAAFEGRIVETDIGNNNYHGVTNAAQIWLDALPDNTARLKSICRNIIKHGGDFDIFDVPKARKQAA